MPANTQTALDVAEIHAKFGKRILRTLKAKGVSEEDAEDIYADVLLRVQTTAKCAFDPEKSKLVTFVCGVLLRNAMSAFFAERNDVAAHEVQAVYDDEGAAVGSAALELEKKGEDGGAETQMAFQWFEAAVARKLADTELAVFEALGTAGILDNSAEDRAVLCADLHVKDSTLVKIINSIKHVVVALWPAHFDTALVTARPIRPQEEPAAEEVVAVTDAAQAQAPAAEPAAATPAVLTPPQPPVALDPIIVRLPVRRPAPVQLALFDDEPPHAASPSSWPGMASPRASIHPFRRAA